MRWRIIALWAGMAGMLTAAPQDLESARKLYDRTEFGPSLAALRAIPDKDGAVYALMGRNYYMRGELKQATDAFEKAMAADPSNSGYALWQGRTFGRRAETASVFSAPGYASKARQYFEKAVQLDPHNTEALSDLFEYYLEAPGFLGGGMEKAQATAERISHLDTGEGFRSEAELAEKRKQYNKAEEFMRRAVEVPPQTVGRLLDLAHFLARQGRYPESDQSLARAEKLAPGSPRVIFAKAEILLKSHRNKAAARQLLERYLTLSLSPDDPPRSQAETLLRQAQGG